MVATASFSFTARREPIPANKKKGDVMMRTYRSETDKIREEIDSICRSCQFSYRIEGEAYVRCDWPEDGPCPEESRIEEIYEYYN